ncbi:MAG: KH domain-containing protein [Wolinella sp.]
MVEVFIEEYAKKIATDVDKIKVVRKDIEENFSEITIFASSQDTGRLIGRDGRMIGALKTLISGCKAKDGYSYKIIVKAAE